MFKKKLKYKDTLTLLQLNRMQVCLPIKQNILYKSVYQTKNSVHEIPKVEYNIALAMFC